VTAAQQPPSNPMDWYEESTMAGRPQEPSPGPRCRQEIQVVDWVTTTLARYIWFCDGAMLKISNEGMPAGYGNGYFLPDWRAVAEDLMTYVVPRPVRDADRRASYARGIGPDAKHYSVQLGPVIHARNLAGLLGANPDDMREVLRQFATLAH
jgi:hypothetical protein